MQEMSTGAQSAPTEHFFDSLIGINPFFLKLKFRTAKTAAIVLMFRTMTTAIYCIQLAHSGKQEGTKSVTRQTAQKNIPAGQPPPINRQNLNLYIDFTYLCNYTGCIPSEGLGIY